MKHLNLLFLLISDFPWFISSGNTRYYATPDARYTRKARGMISAGKSDLSSKSTISEEEVLVEELELINPYITLKDAEQCISKMSEKHSYQEAAKELHLGGSQEEKTKSMNRLLLVMQQLKLLQDPTMEIKEDLVQFALEAKDVKLVYDVMKQYEYKLTSRDAAIALRTKEPQVLQFVLTRSSILNDKNPAQAFITDSLKALSSDSDEIHTWPMIAVLYSAIHQDQSLKDAFIGATKQYFVEHQTELQEFLGTVEKYRTFEEFDYQLFESAFQGVPFSEVHHVKLDQSQKKLQIFLTLFYIRHKGDADRKKFVKRLYELTFDEPLQPTMDEIEKSLMEATSEKSRRALIQKYYPTSDVSLPGSTMLDRTNFIWKIAGAPSLQEQQQPQQKQQQLDDTPTLDQEEESADTAPLNGKLLRHWEAVFDAADRSSREETSSSLSTEASDEEETVEESGEEDSLEKGKEKTKAKDDASTILRSESAETVPLKRVQRAKTDNGLEHLYKRSHRFKAAPEEPAQSLEAAIKEIGDKIREQKTPTGQERRTKEAKQQIDDVYPSRSLEENINVIGESISQRDTQAEKDAKIQMARQQIANHVQKKRLPTPLELLKGMSPQELSKQQAQFFLSLRNEPKDEIRIHLSSELGLAQLAALGDNGPSSPCEHLGSIFPALSPPSIKSIRPECIVIISPEYFATLSYEQFEVIEIEAILADQASFLSPSIFSKLAVDQAKRFASQLDAMESSCAACSGFMADQLSEISSRDVFLAFGEGIYLFNQAELFKCPDRTISWLPSTYLKTLRSDAPSLDLLFAKMAPEQFGFFPRYYENVEESPFYGLEMSWSEIGGTQHRTVVPVLSIQSIEVMNPATLGSMSSGEFALLNAEVMYNISAEAFVCIPAEAIPYDQVELLMTVNTKLCEHFTPAHMQDIDRASIPAYCASHLNDETWSYVVQHASSLNDDFLALESGDRLAELDVSKCEAFKKKNWSQLGSKLLGEDHPCAVLKLDGLPEAFWKGINPACFAALTFVEELSEKQLRLVPQSTLNQIPEEILHRLQSDLRPSKLSKSYSQMTPSLLRRMSPEDQREAMKHLSELPPLTLTSLSEDLGKGPRWTEKVLFRLGRDKVSKLSPEFLDGLDQQQLKAMDPLAAGGLSLEQLDAIEYLRPEAFEFLDPSVLSDMTPDQLNSIPVESLHSHLSRQQVAAIEPEVMEKMARFEEIGRGVDPLSPDHPCLGIGTKHTNVFSPEMAMKYRRHCQPVLDSQKLNHQSEL